MAAEWAIGAEPWPASFSGLVRSGYTFNPHIDTSRTIGGDYPRRYPRLTAMPGHRILVMDLLQNRWSISHRGRGFNVARADLSVAFRDAQPVLQSMGPTGNALSTAFAANWESAVSTLE